MCGLAGYAGNGNRDDLDKMIAAIKHRGPDSQGVFTLGNIGLAHARLSIIDLSPLGDQPMFNAAKSIGIVFNGEIYNFKELREDLLKLGKYGFLSKSDTEVIIYLYEEYGEDCFSKLNGMFAIAIYDFRHNKLILARDRLGKKPLYWAKFGPTLIFGSELKALMRHSSFQKKLNLQAVNKYLLYEYVPTPWSICEGVYKLEPATILTYAEGRVQKKRFWQVSGCGNNTIKFDDALTILDRELERSVKARLIADVPLGIFLSGGLDSSTIAYYAQKNSMEKIKTFSIGFKEDSFDESLYAKKAADFLGTDHASAVLEEKDALALLPLIFNSMDEPLADASLIPTFLLSKFTRKHATVALSGDGGDELFAGYPTFQAHAFYNFYVRTPAFLRKYFIEKLLLALPVSCGNFSLDFKVKKFIEGTYSPRKEYVHQTWLGSFNSEARARLFRQDLWEDLKSKNEFEETDYYFKECNAKKFEDRLLYVYLRTYLMDGVLVKTDRASMLNALEVRSPFLDYHLVDFASSLPYNMKYKRFTTKYILKKLMEDKLPRDIVFRRKKGFGMPVARWLKGELRNFCSEILSEDAIKRAGLFNFDYIDRLKNEHFSGKKDNRKKLWTLLVLQTWLGKNGV